MSVNEIAASACTAKSDKGRSNLITLFNPAPLNSYYSPLPRVARLDHPGLLHHVMARGLNRQKIFADVIDLNDFVTRIETSLDRSPSEILAWALMPNHIHLLIRSGAQGLSSFMRRLLTGYALAFNRRHHRSGYLYQGRYKSLVCDEEQYLLSLVRYIHLNRCVVMSFDRSKR